MECYTHVFDYASGPGMQNFRHFVRDKLFTHRFITDRVRRLTEVLDTYLKEGHTVHVYAHSHGALLTHRALQHLGRRYKRQILPVFVVTGGPARFVPRQTKTYRVRSALNVINENDWILKALHPRLRTTLLRLERDRTHRVRTSKGNDIYVHVRTVRDPDVKRSSVLSHLAYFDLGGRHELVQVAPYLIGEDEYTLPEPGTIPVPKGLDASVCSDSWEDRQPDDVSWTMSLPRPLRSRRNPGTVAFPMVAATPLRSVRVERKRIGNGTPRASPTTRSKGVRRTRTSPSTRSQTSNKSSPSSYVTAPAYTPNRKVPTGSKSPLAPYNRASVSRSIRPGRARSLPLAPNSSSSPRSFAPTPSAWSARSAPPVFARTLNSPPGSRTSSLTSHRSIASSIGSSVQTAKYQPSVFTYRAPPSSVRTVSVRPSSVASTTRSTSKRPHTAPPAWKPQPQRAKPQSRIKSAPPVRSTGKSASSSSSLSSSSSVGSTRSAANSYRTANLTLASRQTPASKRTQLRAVPIIPRRAKSRRA